MSRRCSRPPIDRLYRIAASQNLRSVAFPAISTGIYGYPLQPATDIAVGTVRRVLDQGTSVDRVIFVCFSPDVLQAYRAAGVPMIAS